MEARPESADRCASTQFAVSGADGRCAFDGLAASRTYVLRFVLPDSLAPALGQSDVQTVEVQKRGVYTRDLNLVYAPQDTTFTLYVAPYTRACRIPFSTMPCLVVKYGDDAPYSNFPDPIDGSQFEPGFEYELVVHRRNVPVRYADGPLYSFRLVRLVSKTAV